MKLLRLTEPIVYPDGTMDVGTRVELIEIDDDLRAVVDWKGKRRRINPALLEDAGEHEPATRNRW